MCIDTCIDMCIDMCIDIDEVPQFPETAASESAEYIERPGTTISGLIRPSFVGPRLDHDAIVSLPVSPLCVAPTEMMFLHMPGDVTE